MKTKVATLAIVVSLVVGFAGGWIVAQAQNIGKLTRGEVWANNWVTDVSLLVTNARNTAAVPPEKTQSIIRTGLNIDSMLLGRTYDSLPKAMKRRVMFYIPAAHTIATEEARSGSGDDKRDLVKFIDCMQKLKLQGGLVGPCVMGARK